MRNRKIVIALVVLAVVFVYIKSIVDLQNDKLKLQDEVSYYENLLLRANDKTASTQELLNKMYLHLGLVGLEKLHIRKIMKTYMIY